MSSTEQVGTPDEVVDCPEWVSAYVIGLSSAGVGPHAIATRMSRWSFSSRTTFDDAIRRTRTLPGLEPRLRWSALVALRIASDRIERTRH